MNKFLTNNVPWKIASFFLAMLLWIIVINAENPILPKEIKGRTIEIIGISELESRGFVLENREELSELEVEVVVKGPRLELEQFIGNEANLEISIDLMPYAITLNKNDAESIEKAVSITVYTDVPGIEIQSVTPEVVSVIFEKEKTVSKSVRTNIIGGSNSEYMTLEPILNPGTVQVSGPRSAMDQMYYAEVDVNADDFSENIVVYTVPVKVVDKDGNIIEGLTTTPEQIEVILPIGKKKEVTLESQFTGTLPEGYIQSNTLIAPNKVTVVGDAAIIDSIDTIKLEPISLNNMVESNTFEVDLLLPNDVALIDKIDGKAVVTVEIEKESLYDYELKTDELAIEIIGEPEGYELEVIPSIVTIVLSGTAENILQVTKQEVSMVVDFTTIENLVEGIQDIPVTFNIEEIVNIKSAPTTIQINVKVIQEESEEESEEESTGDLEEEPSEESLIEIEESKEETVEEQEEEDQEESQENQEVIDKQDEVDETRRTSDYSGVTIRD